MPCLRFYTENFPDFINAPEKNAGSTIKLFSCRNYRNILLAKRVKSYRSPVGRKLASDTRRP